MGIDKVNMTSTEHQWHGKVFEMKIAKELNLTLETSHISKWDAYTETGVPVSIKLTQLNGGIGFGSLYRQSEVTEDFYLIAGWWQGSKTNIVRIDYLYIPASDWQTHFNKSYFSILQSALDSVTNDHADDIKWKLVSKPLPKAYLNSSENILLSVAFKRDHWAQKRIQCGIPNKLFYSYFYPRFKVNSIK